MFQRKTMKQISKKTKTEEKIYPKKCIDHLHLQQKNARENENNPSRRTSLSATVYWEGVIIHRGLDDTFITLMTCKNEKWEDVVFAVMSWAHFTSSWHLLSHDKSHRLALRDCFRYRMSCRTHTDGCWTVTGGGGGVLRFTHIVPEFWEKFLK